MSIKNSKKNFIATRFFILIKIFYIFEFFIVQELIHETKNSVISYFMDQHGAVNEKKLE